MGYPALSTEQSTVQNEHHYKVHVTFGNMAISAYKARNATIARTGVGVYDVTLPMAYRRFTELPRAAWQKAAGSAMLVATVTSVTSLGSGSAPKFEVTITTAAGVATDPADTEIATLDFALTQDSANDGGG